MARTLATLLAVLPLFLHLPIVRAGGVIACYSSRLNGGVGNIPIHNPEFYDGTDTYIGGPFNLDCGEMVGRSDGYSNWEGSDGRSISADFWITDDQCMNVMTGGVHYWCCTGGIKQGSGSVTQCNYT
ncbi:hypothetical protein L226DRAFT_614921 [Lentinus tigrinus ALCF2SS1-7]|uniref:Cyanovirin-N domain-containing protein n=1 Tax=Lentinus tigrinus ALCF2SS1-6 TaxID=1328759 RepID=A0A5C2S3F8_9APHY|nr:hypothetical protein L227DRAFT_655108 [Lentinus tigrinus ALCF2SS1-6]RPD72169.1 hypothetical protein L226DRAFT_614921 [Lentinus tigrinus ALCF2SS1-7]